MNEKINLQELTALLAEKANISKKEADAFLREFFGLLSESLISDTQIKVKNLGTFKLIQVEDRESVNVRTGERVLIPAHQKISFSPSNQLGDTINEPFALFEPVELEDSDSEEMQVDDPDEDDEDISDVNVIPINENLEEDSEDNYTEKITVNENNPVSNLAEATVDNNSQPEITNILPIAAPITTEENNQPSQDIQSNENPGENANKDEIAVPVAAIPEKETNTDSKDEIPEVKEETPPPPVPPAATPRKPGRKRYEPKKKSNPWKIFFVVLLILGLIGAGVFAYLWYSNMDFRKSVYSTISTITTPSKKKDNVPIEDYTRKENPVDSTEINQKAPVTDSIPSDTVSHTKETDSMKKEEVPASEAPKSDSEPKVAPGSKDTPVSKEKTPTKESQSQGKTHTLKSGERLTLLALREYGHKIFWVYIYEENKNELTNPDVVPVGTVLKIPPAQKYGINKNDTGSIDKAKALARKYESNK